ncbi:MAG: alpha/beta hydrolase [Fulvimarina manganoxydans]|nr:alpha/beta hydrolase [Fulvimarina manganoxydans]
MSQSVSTSPTPEPCDERRSARRRGFSRSARALRFIAAILPAFALTACAAALNAVTSGAGYDVVRNVPYGDGERAKLDLYIPTRTTPTTPVVVFVHGGSWDTGSKDIYLFVGQSLASEGFIVAIPNYRLYPQVRFPAFVEDVAKAVVKVERMMDGGVYGVPGGDHPIVLMGHSAGAEIAGLLATDGRYLKAAGGSIGSLAGFIGLAGPYDFLPLTEERYKRIFPEATREASQPVNFVSGDEPPMLLIHGADDTTVDPKNTLSLAEKARAAGVFVRDRIVQGVDHVGAITALATAIPFNDETIRRDIVAFVKARAGGGETGDGAKAERGETAR